MTNQQYIEEIIKVAMVGNYRNEDFIIRSKSIINKQTHENISFNEMLLDPNFFRAIGKVKKWEVNCNDHKTAWEHNWHRFIDKIAEKDLDHAIEWLYKLISKKRL